MIPISLYVSVEIIKMGQVFFILHDADLYDPVSKKRVQCRALNITGSFLPSPYPPSVHRC